VCVDARCAGASSGLIWDADLKEAEDATQPTDD
jgi:hypothetical protein